MNPITQLARASRPIFRSLTTTRPLASAPLPIPETGFCFELNDEQKALQELARKFTKEEIIPVASQYDKSGEYPWPIVKKAWEVGLMNGHVPEHCGGLGSYGVLDECIVGEEFAFGCSGIATAVGGTNLGEVAGGMGLGTFDQCLVAEEIAFGCAGMKAAICTTNIGVSCNPLTSTALVANFIPISKR